MMDFTIRYRYLVSARQYVITRACEFFSQSSHHTQRLTKHRNQDSIYELYSIYMDELYITPHFIRAVTYAASDRYPAFALATSCVSSNQIDGMTVTQVLRIRP